MFLTSVTFSFPNSFIFVAKNEPRQLFLHHVLSQYSVTAIPAVRVSVMLVHPVVNIISQFVELPY